MNGPHILSFSGGRTSGLMLHRWLDEHDGLPADHHVVFCNTGKERPETLDFVARCGAEWGVHINWLEYRDNDGLHDFDVVSHNSASRAGEPFTALIRRKRMVPNLVTRFCTEQLKVKTVERWATALGIGRWTSIIGLRADEPNRIKRMEKRNTAGKDRWHTIAPLAEAGIAKRDVMAFWGGQPFDLGLVAANDGSTPDGNCDLCFMKRLRNVMGAIERDPSSADWWIEQEAWTVEQHDGPYGKGVEQFRMDWPSYAAMKAAAIAQQPLPFDEMTPAQVRRRADVCGDTPDPCGCFE